jgi:Second Messenger Oligonucleotide or Dinucleotide Synthetase domain
MLSRDAAVKQNIVGHLERICQQLELTETQYETAENRYKSVGEVLADSEHPALRKAQIYPQGSISLRTSVKPLKGNEYDVDLVCFVQGVTTATSPQQLKRLIGDRLRQNGNYRDILEEKPRCWRLNYANEFHLDITPSIRNPECHQGGELVPDKNHDAWKASNPKGYRKLFDSRAELEPTYSELLFKAANRMYEASSVAPFPDQEARFKGTLRRCVQIFKRHRDEYFQRLSSDYAPISVILTTLASQSYVHCVKKNVYDTEFDILVDVIRTMPMFIGTTRSAGGVHYSIMNETTRWENFAEKWNTNAWLPHYFYKWQARAVEDLDNLAEVVGADNLRKSMNSCFGESVVAKSFEMETRSVSDARARGLLSIVPGVGLTTLQTPAKSVIIPSNTFFGN